MKAFLSEVSQGMSIHNIIYSTRLCSRPIDIKMASKLTVDTWSALNITFEITDSYDDDMLSWTCTLINRVLFVLKSQQLLEPILT